MQNSEFDKIQIGTLAIFFRSIDKYYILNNNSWVLRAHFKSYGNEKLTKNILEVLGRDCKQFLGSYEKSKDLQ